MEVRNIKTKDYQMLHQWWVQNRFPPPGVDDLPMVNGEFQGLIVYEGNTDICAGFFIDTTVKNGAMVEYPVANFDVKDRELRKEALNFLFESLGDIGRRMGKKYLFISLKHPSLMNRLKDSGFIETSVGTTEMIKAL